MSIPTRSSARARSTTIFPCLLLSSSTSINKIDKTIVWVCIDAITSEMGQSKWRFNSACFKKSHQELRGDEVGGRGISVMKSIEQLFWLWLEDTQFANAINQTERKNNVGTTKEYTHRKNYVNAKHFTRKCMAFLLYNENLTRLRDINSDCSFRSFFCEFFLRSANCEVIRLQTTAFWEIQWMSQHTWHLLVNTSCIFEEISLFIFPVEILW